MKPPKANPVEIPRRSLWKRVGFGALSVSLAVHVAFLTGGLFWILGRRPPPPEKRVDFLPQGGGREAGGPSKLSKPVVSRLEVSAQRAAAVGMTGGFVLPEPDDVEGMPGMEPLGGALSGGMGGSDGGAGGGAGGSFGPAAGALSGAKFFDLEGHAERVAYVIDFSLSMEEQGRDKLMRAELAKSLKGLSPMTSYQLIFFSGPAWVAGDEVVSKGPMAATVRSGGREYEWTGKSMWSWKPVSAMQQPRWLAAGPLEIEKSLEVIEKTKLVGGTDWESPMEMAIGMKPPPEVIFFMTDGSMPYRDVGKLVRSLGSKARSRKVMIHAIAMMLDEQTDAAAIASMRELAKLTGGRFKNVAGPEEE